MRAAGKKLLVLDKQTWIPSACSIPAATVKKSISQLAYSRGIGGNDPDPYGYLHSGDKRPCLTVPWGNFKEYEENWGMKRGLASAGRNKKKTLPERAPTKAVLYIIKSSRG